MTQCHHSRHPLTRTIFGSWILAICLATFPTGSFAQSERPDRSLSTAEIARRVTPSVVTISTPTANGSGVIVDPSGVVVTNLHVVQGDTEVEVTLSNGDIYDDVRVVDLDERRDLLLLKIKAFNVAPATLGNSDDVEVGADVVLVGSPQGLDSTVSEGVISAIRDTGNGYRMLQTSAPASPGSSGGGMFNAYGALIGIVTSQTRQGQNLNFAVPINYVRGLLSTEATMTLAELTERARSTDDTSLGRADTASPTRDVDAADSARFTEIMEGIALDDDLNELLELQDTGDGLWIGTYKGGNNLEEILVGVTLITDDFDDAMVWIRAGPPDPDAGISASQLTELLQLSYNLNYAKVTLDDDGSLYTMLELELRTLDTYGLILGIYAVADAADDVARLVDTWSFAGEHASALTRESRTDDAILHLLDNATSIRFSPTEWFEQPPDSTDITKQYVHVSGEVFVALIAERSQIPIDRMPELALQNMQREDSSAQITTSGYRTVNDVRVAFAEISASPNSIPATFLGHFYSDSAGTVQIIGWTTRNLFDEHKSTIEQFAAGLEVSAR